MADIDIDQAALDAVVRSWDGDVGDYLGALLDAGEAAADALVPRDTGRLAASVRQVRMHDEDGDLKGLIGAGREAPVPAGRAWKGGFPVQNAFDHGPPPGTWNRAPRGHPRTRGKRAERKFITGALRVIEAIVQAGG